MKRVLVIEDDLVLLGGLKTTLELEGYEVLTATDGPSGLSKALHTSPDAMLLDITLPRLSGFDVCRTLKEMGSPTPILMLTARTEERDKVLAFELGADDYVTKPFSIHELLARIRVLIRRSSAPPSSPERVHFGNIDVDFLHQQARKGRRKLSLSTLEFEVLRYLAGRRGRTVSREQLLNDVWGYQAFPMTRSVDNLVARLRRKLECYPHEPRHILTVHGAGYRFVD